MGKILITKRNVNSYLDSKEKCIYIDKNKILTPGSKDIIRKMGIKIVYGKPLKREIKDNEKTDIKDLRESIKKILIEEYSLKDKEKIHKIVKKVFDRISD